MIIQYHLSSPFPSLKLILNIEILNIQLLLNRTIGVYWLYEELSCSNSSKKDTSLIGHSQGGLLMRVMTQVIDNHNIDTLVSMAGVQNGIYGAGFLNNKLGNLTGLVSLLLHLLGQGLRILQGVVFE